MRTQREGGSARPQAPLYAPQGVGASATWLVFEGPRLRVEITSSSFPRWDRNLNTGEDTKDSTRSEVAHQRVFHDPERPSNITLTVVES